MTEAGACPRCGAPVEPTRARRAGRPRKWCSARCRRAASEERRAAAAGAIGLEFVKVEATLDDHVAAVLGSPAACRRIIRALRERNDDGSLSNAQWVSVAEELQRDRPRSHTQLRWGSR